VTDRSLGLRFYARRHCFGAHDRGINHYHFVVVITRQKLENALENAARGSPVEARIDHLPVPETLRQIAPGRQGIPRSPSVRTHRPH
jgi:hypothetical protein